MSEDARSEHEQWPCAVDSRLRTASAPDQVAALTRIYGRVQGVGYRYWARSQATNLQLKGYVRNLTDGSVEALFIGPPHNVARMLTYCEEGPPSAQVARVESHALPQNHPRDFQGFRRAPTRQPGGPL